MDDIENIMYKKIKIGKVTDSKFHRIINLINLVEGNTSEREQEKKGRKYQI